MRWLTWCDRCGTADEQTSVIEVWQFCDLHLHGVVNVVRLDQLVDNLLVEAHGVLREVA